MWDLFLSAVDRTASCALNVFWWPLNSLLCFCFPDLTQWPAPPPVRVHLPLDLSEYTKCCKFKATAGKKCRKYFSQCSCSASTRLERAVRDSSLFIKNRHENPLAITIEIYTRYSRRLLAVHFPTDFPHSGICRPKQQRAISKRFSVVTQRRNGCRSEFKKYNQNYNGPK